LPFCVKFFDCKDDDNLLIFKTFVHFTWVFGRNLLGHLADFHLPVWTEFAWSFGKNRGNTKDGAASVKIRLMFFIAAAD